ncbi:MAG: HD domain-containing protein [Bacteroidales bacterium]|nr:HD domain-containing protein [Bacteroidales bacterium]
MERIKQDPVAGKAYALALKALDGVTRGNGHPFIEHAIGVALIVRDEIGLPSECLAAVFLHEAGRMNKEFTVPKGEFSSEVLLLKEGLDKISTINPKDTRLEADNYKKLIVSYCSDPRAAVIKLADRLEVMRSLSIFPKASRERKILESLMLYIPLAHQLGLYNMKSEMEDIYFKWAEPEVYRSITNKLLATENDRQQLMTQFIEPLKKKLSDKGIQYKLKIRTKTAWSIWKKMQKQKVPFEGVFDVFAIRFIIDCDPTDRQKELALCWDVFSLVTEKYKSDTSRLRDWLTKPKPNGYESLHITVKNDNGVALEVQIRTRRMDEIAESGLASHWSYKGIKQEATLDKWLSAVRESLEKGQHGQTLSPPDQDGQDMIPSPQSNEIFVFTPSGELRRLRAGATVLDFAFEIHTNIGSKCVSGKINGKVASIRDVLHTGDVVEILTSRHQKPTADWLNYVVTSKARNKIKLQLGEVQHQKAAEGKEILSRRLKNWKLSLDDEEMTFLLKEKDFKTLNEFYASIGDEETDVASIKDWILERQKAREEEERRRQESAMRKADENLEAQHSEGWNGSSGGSRHFDILVLDTGKVRGLEYKMSKCCNPVFGDDVFAFVTRTEGIKIHRISCPNASRLLEKYPYRVQKVMWSRSPSTSTFQTTLKLTTEMDHSLTTSVSNVINNFKASIRSFLVNENLKNGVYDITVKLSVPSNLELDKIISQLKNLKGILRITRS